MPYEMLAADPFRFSQLDILAAHDLDHFGPGETGHIGNDTHGQSHHRNDARGDRLRSVVQYRKHRPVDAENDQQQQAEHEGRDRNADDRQDGRDRVPYGVAVQGRHDPEQDPDDRTDDRRSDPEREGNTDARTDKPGHAHVALDSIGNAEIAFEHIGDVNKELLQYRLVQTIGRVDRRFLGLGQLFVVKRCTRHQFEDHE